MHYVAEAIRLSEAARKHGLPIRVMGACATKIHCQEQRDLYDRIFNRAITDIDFMARGRDRERVKRFLTSEGYQASTRLMAMTEEARHLYENPNNGIHVDVFFDELSMCHRIDFRERLDVDFPTISLADLLLEKLQIVQINEKDIKDTIVVLLAHNVGDGDLETINGAYIAKLLSKDWGFYYTVTTNLRLVEHDALPKYKDSIGASLETVASRIRALRTRIESEDKSISWRVRAKVGTSKKWYTEVEDVVRNDVAELAGLTVRERTGD